MFNLKILDLKTTASGHQKRLIKTAELMFRKYGQKGTEYVLRPQVGVKYTKPTWLAVDLSKPVAAANEVPFPSKVEVANRKIMDEVTNRKAVGQ
jgi:hypothetical protein